MVSFNNHIVSESEQNKLYLMLMERYTLAKNRSDEIVSRAQNLLGFTSIINTILIGFLLSAVSNKDVRMFIDSSKYSSYLKLFLILGLLSYFISIYYILKTVRITKYVPAPQINSSEFIRDYFEGNVKLSLYRFSLQLYAAIKSYDESNNIRYGYLLKATTYLLAAILLTTLSGIIVLLMLDKPEHFPNTINCTIRLFYNQSL